MAKICPRGFQPEDLEKPTPLLHLLYTQNILQGRWKLLILDFLAKGPQRFSQLQRHLGNLSQGSLTKQLKEMEADGLLQKEIYPQVPPRVDYQLTHKGRDLLPILELMVAYGQAHMPAVEDRENNQRP
ncbi:winged helix-turn-helix transcriptional regulator [Streptococcus cuniculipharyngis]|uniref:Helix-turn-helix transcriptional regulator n=1 Tax=Streptococcus cuniculipharyngis TaxID=1562651 RepID=A0A5C5SGY9_9STRE|nr:helix-turn-helix domain-containing protein [Streptococcus cuniculipharyngis]TWS99181.1 helix-turn-helix transcriptional regulator [Streptococcus cuniculipharyngis]